MCQTLEPSSLKHAVGQCDKTTILLCWEQAPCASSRRPNSCGANPLESSRQGALCGSITCFSVGLPRRQVRILCNCPLTCLGSMLNPFNPFPGLSPPLPHQTRLLHSCPRNTRHNLPQTFSDSCPSRPERSRAM